MMHKIVVGLAGIVMLVVASTSSAQMKPGGPEATHGSGSGTAQSPQMPMMTPEVMAAMCSQMGHQMGHPMMGTGMGMGMGMMGTDPKAQARMLRFRADMMKAMSDVMLKYAGELDKVK